jgi:PAS domain S-box-containing protein
MTPPNERALADPRRLEVLRETGLLDSGAEEGFDRLTRLATRILGVPVALVTLVDENRQFFKSCVGLPLPWATARETPLSHSFCQYTVMTGEPLIVEDAREHPELRLNGAVPDLGVIAYAGIPLITTTGERLGTFCAIDGAPHQWSEDELGILRDLAAAAATEIELRLSLLRAGEAAKALEQSYRDREEVLDATTDGIYTVDGTGILRLVNRAAAELLGYAREEMIGANAHDLFHHTRRDGDRYPEAECPIARAARTGSSVLVMDEVLWRRDGTPLPVAYASSPVVREGVLVGAVVRFTDISEQRRASEGIAMLAESGRLLASSLDLEATLRAVAELAVSQFAEIAVVDLPRTPMSDSCRCWSRSGSTRRGFRMGVRRHAFFRAASHSW